VFVNLIWAKRKWSNRSYEQIYNTLYNKRRHTKSERALRRIETAERRGDKTQAESLTENDGSLSSSEDEFAIEMEPMNSKKKVDSSKNLYPKLREPAMPKIVVNRDPKGGSASVRGPEGEDLLEGGSRPDGADSKDRSGPIKLVKLLPSFLQKPLSRSASNEETNEQERLAKAKEKEERERLKQEKDKEKVIQKEVNARRKSELRELARKERKRRNTSNAVNLLITWLRLMTSFALMIGNIHKTFIPYYMRSPDDEIDLNKPDMLMIFTITMMLDILLFWFFLFWNYCQQCRLCCRLGCCRFWLWLMALGFIGGVCMYTPAHLIQEQLDETWCVFLPGTPLNEYFDG